MKLVHKRSFRSTVVIVKGNWSESSENENKELARVKMRLT